MSNLVKYENQAIRVLSETDYNAWKLQVLIPTLEVCLGMNEKAADKVIKTLPAFEDICRGLTPAQVIEMIKLYADSKLNLEPIPNHIDRITLAKMVNAYRPILRDRRRAAEDLKLSPEEEAEVMNAAIKEGLEEYAKTGHVPQVTGPSRYDWLDKNGDLWETLGKNEEEANEYKKGQYNRAKELLLATTKSMKASNKAEKRKFNEEIRAITSNKSGNVIAMSKIQILRDYYEIKNKSK